MKKVKLTPQELEAENKAVKLAAIVMLFLALIYFMAEMARGNGSNPALYSMIAAFDFVLFGYKAIKIKKNRKLNAFTSIIWGLLTIMLILDYFKVI